MNDSPYSSQPSLVAATATPAQAAPLPKVTHLHAVTCTPSWSLAFGANKSVVRTGHTVRWVAIVSTAPDGCALTDVNLSVTPPDGVVQYIATNATVGGDGGSERFRTSPYVAHGPGTMTASVVGSGLADGNSVGGSTSYQVRVKP